MRHVRRIFAFIIGRLIQFVIGVVAAIVVATLAVKIQERMVDDGIRQGGGHPEFKEPKPPLGPN